MDPTTISETIAPTEAIVEATEAISEVIEATEAIDYTGLLTEIALNSKYSAEFLQLISGLMLFFAVVALCYFAYKFLRIFF